MQLSRKTGGFHLDDTTRFLGLITVMVLAGFLVFALYRAHKRERVRRIQAWIQDYLTRFYKRLVPGSLHVNCSDDPLWPVIVRFTELKTGLRRCLQFECPGSGKYLMLLSAVEETAT